MINLANLNSGLTKYALFDLDGTVAATEEFLTGIWCEVAHEKHHHDLDPEVVRSKIQGRPGELVLGDVLPEWSGEKREDFFQDVLRVERERFGHIELNPGAGELIMRLCDAGYTLSVVTMSYLEKLDSILVRHGLQGCFQNNVTREDVGEYVKPAPHAYHLARQKNGNPPVEACIAFEDSKAGMQSAKAAGLTCIGYGSHQLQQNGADLVIMDFAEVQM